MNEDINAAIAVLSDTAADPGDRRAAAERLAHLGADAQAAAVALVQTVADDDEELREWAVAALEGLGAPRAAETRALAALLSHEHLDVAYWAATLLGRLEAEAAEAVPALAATVSRPTSPAVRQRAAWALGQIGPAASSALDALRAASKSSDPRLARIATDAIASIGG